MTGRKSEARFGGDGPGPGDPDIRFVEAALDGDTPGMALALAHGANVNAVHHETGLPALHLAVGLNRLAVVRYLVEECGASFFPDRFGRWPTLVAAECGVDDELADYIVTKEAEFLARQQP